LVSVARPRFWAIFVHHGNGIGHGGAETNAGDEAPRDELIQSSGKGGCKARKPEDQYRDGQDRFTSKSVRQRSRGE